MSFSDVKQLASDTFQAYSEDHGERLAAALAYYATFSMAPLIVLAFAVAGLLYGQRSEEAQAEFMVEVENVLGTDGASLMEGLLESAAAAPDTGLWATILSGLLLLVGATALFARLQEALNTIWNTTPQYTGLLGFLRSRGISLLLVIGVGAILVASLMLSSVIAGVADLLAAPVLVRAGERLGSLAILTLLFAVLYRTLPDSPVRWSDVWAGALLTAFLVTLGNWAFGWYLGRASVTSSYGAGGALVALLLWIYYSAQIFFLGAELTTVYARRRAHETIPPISPMEQASSLEVHPPSRSRPWLHRLGWVALGIVLARFFQR